jgi:hypothetical protein
MKDGTNLAACKLERITAETTAFNPVPTWCHTSDEIAANANNHAGTFLSI